MISDLFLSLHGHIPLLQSELLLTYVFERIGAIDSNYSIFFRHFDYFRMHALVFFRVRSEKLFMRSRSHYSYPFCNLLRNKKDQALASI